MPETMNIVGVWTKAEWEGSCSICRDKAQHDVGKIVYGSYNRETLRLCYDCMDAFRSLLNSLLEDAPE